jgi:hypothetical protein
MGYFYSIAMGNISFDSEFHRPSNGFQDITIFLIIYNDKRKSRNFRKNAIFQKFSPLVETEDINPFSKYFSLFLPRPGGNFSPLLHFAIPTFTFFGPPYCPAPTWSFLGRACRLSGRGRFQLLVRSSETVFLTASPPPRQAVFRNHFKTFFFQFVS